MNRAAEDTLAIGSAIKGLPLALGSMIVLGYAIYLIATGHFSILRSGAKWLGM